MWGESWAQPAMQWLLTPALVTGALLALVRLYDPPTRWGRRLSSDIAILGGLPDGAEKRVWQASVDWQATRLREYRRAFVGWTLFWKWAVVGIVAITVFGLILYPPVNEPGEPAMWGPADYMFIFLGLYSCAIYVVSVSTGRDLLGRSPRELLLLRRLHQYNRRRRRLLRIEKARVVRAKTDQSLARPGSRRGFETQVDEFGPWMRDHDLRGYVRNAGFIAADIRGRYYTNLRRRGVPFPPWPDPETRCSPEPTPVASPRTGEDH